MVKTAHYKLLFYFNKEKTSPEMLAKKVGVHINTVKKYLKFLEREGLVKTVGFNEYVLEEKGKLFITSIKKIIEKNKHAYVVTDPDSGEAIPVSFKDYKQLFIIYKYELVPRNILEEHFKKGYIINWIKNSMGDEYLLKKIENGEIKNLKDLINYIEKIISVVEEIAGQKRNRE